MIAFYEKNEMTRLFQRKPKLGMKAE